MLINLAPDQHHAGVGLVPESFWHEVSIIHTYKKVSMMSETVQNRFLYILLFFMLIIESKPPHGYYYYYYYYIYT